MATRYIDVVYLTDTSKQTDGRSRQWQLESGFMSRSIKSVRNMQQKEQNKQSTYSNSEPKEKHKSAAKFCLFKLFAYFFVNLWDMECK